VVLNPGETVSAEDIHEHLQQFVKSGQIKKWTIPQGIDFVDDIPKTSVGKVNKKLIRDQVGNG